MIALNKQPPNNIICILFVHVHAQASLVDARWPFCKSMAVVMFVHVPTCQHDWTKEAVDHLLLKPVRLSKHIYLQVGISDAKPIQALDLMIFYYIVA